MLGSQQLRRSGLLIVCAGVFALTLSFACGPIEYVNQVTRRASSEVDAAKAVKADKHAPYWYTLAVEYLHKAREEAATADFQAANRFGRRSSEAARKARALAVDRAQHPQPREPETTEPATEEAEPDDSESGAED